MPDDASPNPSGPPRKIWGFPRNVFFMGWVSFFTDISSEMIAAVLPLFLENVIGASKTTIGIIEGIAESTASLLKVLSGWLSDLFKSRKPLAVGGYSLSTVAKGFLPFAASAFAVFAFRFFDRVGKGIRSAPVDALIADSTPAHMRGKAFGFHKAMDTAGAVIGPLIAFLVLALIAGDGYRTLFWIALLPALISILILIFFVHEKQKAAPPSSPPLPFSFRGFHAGFFLLMGIVLIFTLGTPSSAFLLLRAENVGIPLVLIPLTYLLFNVVFALTAFPAGAFSDKIGRSRMILGGYLVFSLAYFGLATVKSPWMAVLLFALYGVYMGMTEGVIKAFVADLVPAESRGTAYGIYHTATGITLLPASVIAGVLWQKVSPSAPFYFGFATSLLAAVLLIIWLFIGNVGKYHKYKEPPTNGA